jgi:predicted TIM-barrel fold metal-dependent hydrolase
MAIDMHSHFMPRGLSDALRKRTKPPMIHRGDDGKERMQSLLGGPPLEEGFDSLEKRIADMDRNGVQRSVLSNVLQDIMALPVEDALPLCRIFNDSISAACVAHPDRFSAFAALPIADMDAAVGEFERAMAMPGMVGAFLPGDGFLSAQRAEKFRPLLEAADRRGAVLMVHYGRMPNDPDAPKPDLTDNKQLRIGTLDMQARISSNMLTFCLTDFLDRYPNLTIMSHNLGGNIPFEVERLDHRTLVDKPDAELPSARFRKARLLVDCNSLGARSIERAVEVYGADKIVFGSDGTHFGMNWSQNAIAEARITDAEKRAILDGNAGGALARVHNRMHNQMPAAAAE